MPDAKESKQPILILKDRFELIEELGAGGMGQVYKAIDRRKLEAKDRNPYIAIKLLNAQFEDHPDAFITLQREAQKCQTLTSPHIVKVFDFDRDDDKIFLTMEYLHGQSLDRVLSSHPEGVELTLAWAIIEQICLGLRDAHRTRIVHADLKPGNILVTHDAASTTKILDFGIARAIQSSDDKTVMKTVFDAGSLGAVTPAYASIEMLEFKALDARDDIYSLGCIIYEILTGTHPFERVNASQAKKLGVSPKPIPLLTKKQWEALNSALALERNDRVASVELLMAALLPATSSQQKTSPWLVAPVCAAIISMGAWFVYDTQHTKHAQTIAPFSQLPVNNAANAPETTNTTPDIIPNNMPTPDTLAPLIRSAQTCYQTEDYPCALTAVDTILTHEPDHAFANTLRIAIRDAQHRRQLEREKQQREVEREQREAARKRQQLIRQQQERARVKQFIAEAKSCFDKRKYDCSIAKSESVLALDPNNQQANTLRKQAKTAQERAKSQIVIE